MKAVALMGLEKYRDHGILIMRVGLGGMFMAHGWPKLVGGPEKWAKIGSAMANLGLDFAPTFWGFMAAVAEFGGGLLLALGLFSRVALALLVVTMSVATIKHMTGGDPFTKWSHAAEAAFTFAGLFLVGAGRFSLDHKLFGEDDDEG